jgi:hypothetical protein
VYEFDVARKFNASLTAKFDDFRLKEMPIQGAQDVCFAGHGSIDYGVVVGISQNHGRTANRMDKLGDFEQKLYMLLNVLETERPQFLQPRIQQNALDFAQEERRGDQNVVTVSGLEKEFAGRPLRLDIPSHEDVGIQHNPHWGWERT